MEYFGCFFGILCFTIILGFVVKIAGIAKQLIYLRTMIDNSICIKKCRNLYILLSDEIQIPLSFSLLNRSYIIINNDLIRNREYFMLAINHEIQHIRNKDTLWVCLVALFKAIFFINPIVSFWLNKTIELQELACDEVLIEEKNICSETYANCLLAAVEQAYASTNIRNHTTFISVSLSHFKKSLVYRRITMIFETKKNINRNYLALLIGFTLSFIIGSTTYAMNGITNHQQRLDKPTLSNKAILKWSQEAVINSFNYDYKNYKNNLENTSHYFTPAGWKNFMMALKSSKNIDAVVAKKLKVSAIVNQSPTISQQGIENGKYVWHVYMPIAVTYMSATEQNKQLLNVNLLITRTNKTHDGIGISQYTINSVN